MRRQGLPGRPQGRRHSAHRPGRDGGRRVRRDDVRPPVPEQTAAGDSDGGNRARRRHPVRPHRRRRLLDHCPPAPGADQPTSRSARRDRRGRCCPAAGGGPLTESARPRILVVDDAGPVVILCVNVLQALGYSIRAANRGETAIELCRKEPFDLLVVDYKMPGMNGFEVLGQARQIRPRMACMLMTAHGTPDIINEATRLGFDYILLKPFTPSELRGAVDKVLASRA
ncbi:MAG: hypothetical protein DMD99_11445 [Candidatus Rokuibacteriota bacterium]|nr:MAG: hypothetical protein DMD99_11445 [Candidatus Rokubacteria bacterium]